MLALTEAHFSWWGASACPMRHCQATGVDADRSTDGSASSHNLSDGHVRAEHPRTAWCLLADDQAAVAPRQLADAYFAAGINGRAAAVVAGRWPDSGGHGGVRYVAWREAGCFGISRTADSCNFFGTPSVQARPGSEEHVRQCVRARWKPAACWQEHLYTARLIDAGMPLQLGPLPFYLSARAAGGTSDRIGRVPRAARPVSC